MTLAELEVFIKRALIGIEGFKALDNQKLWKEFCEAYNFPDKKGEAVRFGLSQYSQLMDYSVNEALLSIYPLTMKFFERESSEMVEHYRRTFPNTSFQMVYAVKNFSHYLATSSMKIVQEVLSENPYLVDLSRYEWLEVKTQNALNTEYPTNFHKTAPLISDAFPVLKPFWNSTMIFFNSTFPITQIVSKLKNRSTTLEIKKLSMDQEENCFEVIYRDPESYKVRFLIVKEFVMSLLNISTKNPELTFEEITNLLNQSPNKEFRLVQIQDLITLYKSLFEKNLLLGVCE
jgi:hypothetical protein